MKSSLPKVLHQAAGQTLIGHVFKAVSVIKGNVGVVLGRDAEAVKKALHAPSNVRFFLQKQRLGSGHAVMAASSWLRQKRSTLLVLCGDAPLIQQDTLRALMHRHRQERNAATLLSARVPNPFGYGRLVRGDTGRVQAIVEEKDASAVQRQINEINSGTYCFETPDLLKALSRIRPNNAKGEYYLTDVVDYLVKQEKPVGAMCLDNAEDILGVNNRCELMAADKILRERLLEKIMAGGVTIVDPDTTYIDPQVQIGRDAVVYPQTFIKGSTKIGGKTKIGPFAYVDNCRIDDEVEIRASFLYDSVVGKKAKIGPYAHVRPGTKIEQDARVGNFVEIKKSRVGRSTKVSHLTYIGDASLGADVNVGAGVITCNYDGTNKFQTTIDSGAFIGSNANLIAPIHVGKGALVGAGSTLNQNVPANALALERSAQSIKPGWVKRHRAKGKEQRA